MFLQGSGKEWSLGCENLAPWSKEEIHATWELSLIVEVLKLLLKSLCELHGPVILQDMRLSPSFYLCFGAIGKRSVKILLDVS